MSLSYLKIIHCADLHLGKADSYGVLERIVNLCSEQKADLLLMAGDVFESINISKRTGDAFISLLASIPSTKVAISPGNHDPYSADSFYNLASLPENVHVFRGKLSKISFDEKNLCLWGAGFTKHFEDRLWDNPEELALLDRGKINICVMHGDLAGFGAEGSGYNFIPMNFVEDAGFDYLALGHIHKRSPVLKRGSTHYAYSGSPEAGGFDETGDLGVYLLEVGKNHFVHTFIRTGEVRYFSEEIEITENIGNAAVADFILQELRKRHGDNLAADRFKITLKGSLPAGHILDPELVVGYLNKELREPVLRNEIRIHYDFEALAAENSLKGLFVKRMLEALEKAKDNEEKEEIERAMDFGLQAFEGAVKTG